jgi:signal transduction histidine kinase
VRGNVDVLLRQLGSGRTVEAEHIVEDLRVVQRESGRMSRLIEDLLTLARTDVASLGELLKPETTRLDELAREAFQIGRQLSTGQNMRLDVPEPVELVADKDRLVQVMIILLENAIRYTPAEGSITLKVDRVVDRESLASCARIVVTDTGNGIAAEHIPHLFERFYRVEKARSRQLGGTGLGLSIALAVARAHSGWIDVDSEPGKGTTFTVWLPFANGFTERDSRAESGSRIRRRLRFSRRGRPKLSPQIDPRTIVKPARSESQAPSASDSGAQPPAPPGGKDS